MGDGGKRELHKKICVDLLISIVVVLLALFLGPKLIQFFMPLIIAWIIATIANPMVEFLENRIKIMRKHGSAIVIVVVLLLVGTLLFLIVRITLQQVFSLLGDLPEIYSQAMQKLQGSLGRLHHSFKFVPYNLEEILANGDGKVNDMISSFLNSLSDSAFSMVGSVASSVIDGFILSVLTLMLSYFFVTKREWLKEEIKKFTLPGIKQFWDMAMDACFRALAGYIKACFKIMIVVFIILWPIYGLLLHAKYASLLALLTAFFDFLPVLGTGVVITPWAGYCLISGEYLNVVILAVAYIICLLVHRLLEPKLVGDSVGMSPFATLLSMFIGYRLIGMLGLILGIPVGMVLIAFKEKGMFDKFFNGIKILATDINEYRKY